VRILIWHGWLLEGSGSNVYAARLAETLTAAGHDVLLLCQEGHPERHQWIDAWGTIGAESPPVLTSGTPSGGPARCVLLRPDIGRLLPVFVFDEYEGFEVKRFVDLDGDELDGYLAHNVQALRAAAAWHGSQVVVAQHAVPGSTVAKRALGPGRYLARITGSDLEYAIRPQPRYLELAREGLGAARAVAGPSSEVLERCARFVPDIRNRSVVVPPGVEVERFHPQPRREALLETAGRLDADPDIARGRTASVDAAVASALLDRDAERLDGLARTYDQNVPDQDAAARLRELAGDVDRPLVGFFGKLIPQKGVELLIAAASLSRRDPLVLVVGFGLHREWVTAFSIGLRNEDAEALAWLERRRATPVGKQGLTHHRPTVIFTGRLDHRYAPGVLAATDVLVVPSVLEEAFGMVAVEGAAAGALPLVARHSGLAEIAATLERAVDRPGLFSFEPGPGVVRRIAEGMDRLLGQPGDERAALRGAVAGAAAREWTWSRTAERLLAAGSP